jgi:HAD superfamily hydrolase (TIGR01459 family)
MIDKFKIIIVDAYGVFNFGKGISKPVIETFKKWIEEGKKVYILSNTTSTNEGTIRSYEKKGVIKGTHYTDILTSGQFAYEDIQAGNLPLNGKKFYVFGTANFKKQDPVPAIFANSSYELVKDAEDADFIYCGIPQIIGEDGPKDSTKIEDFVCEVECLVKMKKPLVCANPDMTANEGGQFVVRQGSIAKLWQEYHGTVIMYGKPDPRIYEALIKRYCPNIDKEDILMVGDTIRTDIKGAHNAGINSLLVLEGGVTEYEVSMSGITLDEYIKKEGITPDYILPRVSKEPLF